ncbi:hypothetical protein NODU109028_15745 [Nocardioides dubius]|uniref:Neocarzinostatin family protein n=1 Tax=Nocardioides dubius TaxID=317019 RepID=A0ABN1U0W4_9ACTN
MKQRAIGAGVVAIATVSALATAAVAAPPYLVTVGASTSGDHVFFGTSVPRTGGAHEIDFQVRRGTTVTNMYCTDVNVEGNVHAGTSSTGHVATITPVTRVNTPETFAGMDWKGCKGPFNLDMVVEPDLDWEIWADGTSTTGTTDVITGVVTGPGGGNLTANVYATGANRPFCEFEVQGFATGTWNESTQTLTITETGFTGNLAISALASATSNCGGLVAVNDPANFEGAFEIGPDDADNTKDGITDTFPVYLEPAP